MHSGKYNWNLRGSWRSVWRVKRTRVNALNLVRLHQINLHTSSTENSRLLWGITFLLWSVFFFFFFFFRIFIVCFTTTGNRIQQWHANRSLLNKTKRCNLRKEITINHIVGLINDKRRQWRVSVNIRQYTFVLPRRKLTLFWSDKNQFSYFLISIRNHWIFSNEQEYKIIAILYYINYE